MQQNKHKLMQVYKIFMNELCYMISLNQQIMFLISEWFEQTFILFVFPHVI